MNHSRHNKIVFSIWSYVDDCQRDVGACGKYLNMSLSTVRCYPLREIIALAGSGKGLL